MNPRPLTPRLALCASLVRPGSRVADIGTDHGYLPVYLVGGGICPGAIAADIRPGPLSRAAETVERAGLAGHISLRLGDGLAPVRPEEAEDIVIAGMGGETIAAILAAATWCQSGRYRLILQPMSRPEALRSFLFAGGYAIEREQAVQEGKRLYTVIQAAYAPEAAAKQAALPAAVHCGGLVPSDPLAKAYLLRQAARMEAAALALRQAGGEEKADALFRTAMAVRQRSGERPDGV